MEAGAPGQTNIAALASRPDGLVYNARALGLPRIVARRVAKARGTNKKQIPGGGRAAESGGRRRATGGGERAGNCFLLFSLVEQSPEEDAP